MTNHAAKPQPKLTQAQKVIESMRKVGGFATFGKLNSIVDFTSWKTKTPEASVRRIVQENPAFFKIRPGLWGLREKQDEIYNILHIEEETSNSRMTNEFDHSYYQGLIVEIGNLKKMKTYIPPQDKNKMFLETPLKDMTTFAQPLDFSYPEIVKRAKTVDVVWLNERRMPYAFFEVEHSTDIQNSLLKYYELQDFNSKFYIVADKYREAKFNDILGRSIFKPIRDRVKFASYSSITDLHTQAYRELYLAAI